MNHVNATAKVYNQFTSKSVKVEYYNNKFFISITILPRFFLNIFNTTLFLLFSFNFSPQCLHLLFFKYLIFFLRNFSILIKDYYTVENLHSFFFFFLLKIFNKFFVLKELSCEESIKTLVLSTYYVMYIN